MALYFYNYATRTSTPGIYVKDLFVEDAYRKRGYGKALLKELAKEVRKVEGKRLELSCWAWNGETIGATRKEESICLRIEGDALDKLLNS
jgi:GNAT superfamily N-acetyltransferase